MLWGVVARVRAPCCVQCGVWLPCGVRRPLPTHKRFLCPWVLVVAPPPTLSWWLTWRSVVVMTRAEAFSHHHLDLRGSTCAPLCCSHASQQVATRTAFGFCCCTAAGLPVTGATEVRGPHLLAQEMSISSASLCCRCTVSGVRPIRFFAVLFVALACRRTIDVSFSRSSQCSWVAMSLTQMGKSWRCSHEVCRFDERMTMR